VLVHADGEMPRVVSTHDTYAEACTGYDAAFDDPANTFKWVQLVVREVRQFRLDDYR